METVRRRRCATCRFHREGPTPCTGTCANIEWQPKSGVTRFVRERELACYRGWGIDSWQPRNGGAASGGPGSSGAGGSSGGGNVYTPVPSGTLVGAPVIPLTPISDTEGELAD